MNVPPFYGLALDDESADMKKIIGDFEDFIKSVCEEKWDVKIDEVTKPKSQIATRRTQQKCL